MTFICLKYAVARKIKPERESERERGEVWRRVVESVREIKIRSGRKKGKRSLNNIYFRRTYSTVYICIYNICYPAYMYT